MKVSEAIAALQSIHAEVGDLEIIGVQEVDGLFAIDYGRVFDVIELPNEDETEFTPVCAFMDPVVDEDCEPRNLRVVK